MLPSFCFLDASLHDYAAAALTFFSGRSGIPKGKFAIEKATHPAAPYAATLHTHLKDHHILCVEVAPTFFTDSLTGFVLDCQRSCVPVRLYVAVPPDSSQRQLSDLERAAKNSVGIVQLGEQPTILREALSLSLTGVREPDLAKFPSRFRAAVSAAHSAFVNGDPVGACSQVYSEIEAITRALAIRADSKSCWKSKGGGATPALAWPTAAWQKVIDALAERLDTKALSCPDLRPPLMARIGGLVDHRNITAHKPKNLNALITRDQRLRTRFEHALDILLELAVATRRLRL